MRLFHFSDDPAIAVFEPRPVRAPSKRREGMEWLNGPLVWAIDELHSMMYLFPRDCPRILFWPRPHTAEEDRLCWMGESNARAVACVEAGGLNRLRSATIYRYEMPLGGFEDLQDAGMWVAREAVEPIGMKPLSALDACLAAEGVELRVMEELAPLRPVWGSTLHASGIRLRNAVNWS